jgi:hypothetical protein
VVIQDAAGLQVQVRLEKEKRMTRIFSRRWKILLFVFISMFLLSACVTQTGKPAANPPANKVFGPGAFTFPDTKAGLADLSSYKIMLKYSFDGTRDGKTEQWSKTYVMLATKDPAARQLTIETTGNIPAVGAVFMAETGGADYERLGQNSCTASVTSKNSLAGWPDPAGFLFSVIGADKTGTETVNAVAANHYTFDERAIGGLGLVKSTGEMWVATDGGYIVRYLLLTKGDAGYFGKGIKGTLTWDYELTDANQPSAIQMPVDCPAGIVNAPQLPDASNVRSVPGLLTYDTVSSLADAAAFYQKQIPSLGWTPFGDPAIDDTTAMLDFTQGNQTMTVIITAGAGGTKVHIMLGGSRE